MLGVQAPAELGHVLGGFVQAIAGEGLVGLPPEVLRGLRAKHVCAYVKFLALTVTCALFSEELVGAELHMPEGGGDAGACLTFENCAAWQGVKQQWSVSREDLGPHSHLRPVL